MSAADLVHPVRSCPSMRQRSVLVTSPRPHDLLHPRPHPRADRHHALLQGLAPGSGAADADEQPRSGRRRAAGGSGRLRRQREGRPELGLLRAHRRHAPAAGERRDAAGPEREAGRRLPDPRGGAAGPDRKRPPGPALGDLGRVPPARGAGPHDVRPDDRRLLDLHRDPGDPAGHLRDLRRVRPAAFRRHPRGPAGGDRRSRRHGRRPAARGDDERRRLPRRGRGRVAHPAPGGHRLLRPAGDRISTVRSAWSTRRGRRGAALSVGLVGNVAEVSARAGAARRGAGRGHRPDLGARSPAGLHPGGLLARSRPPVLRERDPAGYEARVLDSMAAHVRAMLDLKARGAVVFDYGNNLRGQVADHRGMREAFDIPGFVPEYIRPLFCKGAGPFRWAALSGDPADIATTDQAVLETFPKKESLARWIRQAQERVAFPGPARPHLLAGVRRAGGDGSPVQLAGATRQGGARRSSSAATIWTPARSHRPTGRPRACATARTRSPTGRCSTRCSTPPAARAGCRCITAAESGSGTRSMREWWPWPTGPTPADRRLERVLTADPGTGRHAARGRGVRAGDRDRAGAGGGSAVRSDR